MSEDTISRKAAIEYFMTNTNWYDEDGGMIEDAEDKRKLLEDYFNALPSAQSTMGQVFDGDTINRQAAVDAVYERIRQIGYENNPLILSIRQAIRDLPSA